MVLRHRQPSYVTVMLQLDGQKFSCVRCEMSCSCMEGFKVAIEISNDELIVPTTRFFGVNVMT